MSLYITIRGKHILSQFGNRILRKTAVLKTAEITYDWIKFHNTELHNLQSSSDTVWLNKSRMRCAGRVDRIRENVHKILVRKPEETTWKIYDNIKTDMQKKQDGRILVRFFYLVTRSWLVKPVLNLTVPQNVGNFFTVWKSISFAKESQIHCVCYIGR
jgi:hypothetical protein